VSETSPTQPATPAAPVRRSTIGAQVPRFGMLLLLLGLVVVFGLLRPGTFLSAENWRSILTENALIALAALAVMVALVANEFDLSVAAVVGLANVLTAGLASLQGLPVPVTLLVVLAVGLAIGGAHGVLIARLRLDSFIVTLGSSAVLTGLILMYTNGRVIATDIPEQLTTIGRFAILGLPVPVWVLVAVTLILWFVLEQRPWGRRLYATGINTDAARLAGVPTQRMKFSALVVAAMLSTMAGLLLAARSGVGHPTIASDYILPAFAAAFLGTAAFRLGFPNPLGTVLAVLVLAVGVNGLTLIGAPFWVNNVFNGLALIVAIGLARVGPGAGLSARLRRMARGGN
jgi:ribose transport system permease protein